jgi:hypothetical protein
MSAGCKRHNMRQGAFINAREQELQQTAERFARQMSDQFNASLDLSVASLPELDGVIAEMIDLSDVYASDRPEDVLPPALAITAYVGEVIRRTVPGAEWVTEEEEGQLPPPHVRLADGMRLNLMKKALEILMRQDSPSFATYYQTVVDLHHSRGPDSPDNG